MEAELEPKDTAVPSATPGTPPYDEQATDVDEASVAEAHAGEGSHEGSPGDENGAAAGESPAYDAVATAIDEPDSPVAVD